MRARPRPSLKAQAIALLAQREHSRIELRRKLLMRVGAHARADAAFAAGKPPHDSSPQESTVGDVRSTESGTSPEPAQAVDELLDWLEAHDYLSASRFTESRVNARSGRFGSERIRRELAQHGVALDPDALRSLRGGELDRARAIWERKFGGIAADASGRAKQARFLAARGFPSDVIRRVVGGLPDD